MVAGFNYLVCQVFTWDDGNYMWRVHKRGDAKVNIGFKTKPWSNDLDDL